MPSRPPSPPLATPGTVSTSETGAPSGPALAGVILSSRLESRSVTSALPSGRNARPHGTARCLAMTSTAACASPDWAPDGEADGLGSFGGAPFWSGGGGPKEHPPSRPAARASTAARRPAALGAEGPQTAAPSQLNAALPAPPGSPPAGRRALVQPGRGAPP